MNDRFTFAAIYPICICLSFFARNLELIQLRFSRKTHSTNVDIANGVSFITCLHDKKNKHVALHLARCFARECLHT